MQLLIIRHGVAVDRDEFAKSGESDDLRPLTDAGRRKVRRSVKGFGRLAAGPHIIATSPLVRALQTAEIVADGYGSSVTVTDVLKPDASFEAFGRWLSRHSRDQLVVVVGHDPFLSTLATWLISGVEGQGIALKKGGGCLLTFDAAPGKGKATMEWLLTPNQLREIGE